MRFQVILEQDNSNGSSGIDYIQIIKDTNTGVLYMFRCRGSHSGLTVMLDKDGKPLLS